MARRKKKRGQRHVTVAIAIGTHGGETVHRASTLKRALQAAERARIPKGCVVMWHGKGPRRYKGMKGVFLDGKFICPSGRTDTIRGIVYRPHKGAPWWKK